MIHFSSRNFNKALIVSFLFIGLMLISRIWYSGTWTYIFIAWMNYKVWATTIIFTGMFSMLYFFICPVNAGTNNKWTE